MLKSTGSKSSKQAKQVKTSGFVERNLSKTSPLKEQFEPTGKNPVGQHKKMAGMP